MPYIKSKTIGHMAKRRIERNISIRPTQGGQLMTSVSSEAPGLSNYTEKRDFRRDLDKEIRREGADWFWPERGINSCCGKNFSQDPGNQPFPNRATRIQVASSTFGIAFFSEPHGFVVGEKIRVVGGDEMTVTSITSTTLAATSVLAAGSVIESAEPINLKHFARRPNGDCALIVGTATTLFRFTASFDNAYAEDSCGPCEYSYNGSETSLDSGAPYSDDCGGEWEIIGRGFSLDGHRWEALNINGWAVFNNGIDLPVTFRVEESEAKPIYQLREQGIASVGAIAEHAGILVCMNIAEIPANRLESVIGRQDGLYVVWSHRSGTNASVSGSTLTATSRFFDRSIQVEDVNCPNPLAPISTRWIGRSIQFDDGTVVDITGVTDDYRVTVSPSGTVSSQGFKVRTKFSQAASSNIVVSSQAYFDISMVGLKIVWDDGSERTITSVTDSTHAVVSSQGPVAIGLAGVEAKNPYGVVDPSILNRITYRMIWSEPSLPRSFGITANARFYPGQNKLSLLYPSKAFENGMSITLIGGATNGGNLSTKIVYSAGGIVFQLADAIDASADASGSIIDSASVGGIVGFQDLQDDGSEIVVGMDLESTLVIYKATNIFLASYTGDASQPFVFRRVEIPRDKAIYYRHTLCCVNGAYHAYAGRDGFYSFELGTRVPKELINSELCKNVFFSKARIELSDEIWVSDNELTHELWFRVPEGNPDRFLIFDYRYSNWNTSTFDVVCAKTIRKPETKISFGPGNVWYLMASPAGAIFIYGLSTEPTSEWGNQKSIFFRRSGIQFSADKISYLSSIASGFANLGSSMDEKQIKEYVIIPASTSENSTVNVTWYRGLNPRDQNSQIVASKATTQNNNYVPLFFYATYVMDRLEIDGVDNPFELSERIWQYIPKVTDSMERAG